MREIKELVQFLNKNQDQDLVLATLIKTEGSTYRKTGAKKLIRSQEDSCGLISGGCLESDIVAFAMENPHKKRVRSFDTTTDEDRLFGTGIGCQGKITLEFEPIDWSDDNLQRTFLNYNEKKDDLKVFIAGSGLDIPPLYEFIQTLGWSLKVIDYRSDWIEKRTKEGWPIFRCEAEEVSQFIEHPQRSALLLMSHNYPYDLEVLKNTIKLNLAYTGILGPLSRKQQMIKDLQTIYDVPVTDEQKQKIHGPIGVSEMGGGETAIALSVVSQLQQIFFGDRN